MLVKIDEKNFFNLEQVKKIEASDHPALLKFIFCLKNQNEVQLPFDSIHERDNYFQDMLHFYEIGKKVYYGPIL